MNLRGVTRYDPGSAPLAPGAPVPYAFMSQPSMSDVHVPTLLRVVRRRKRRKKKKDLKKHYGPGAHPSGTEQDVHGRGRQRTHYTSAEQEHLSERRQRIQDRQRDISIERSNLGRWVEPDDGGPPQWVVDDLEHYDALEQEMNDLSREWSSTYDPIEPISATSGIGFYGGSLTTNEIDLVRRRLGQIDTTRRRLLGRLEEFSAPRGLGSMEDQTELHRIQHQIEELDAEEGELLVALTTPTLPGMEGPIVAEEAPPKPVRSASGKKTGTIYDANPAEDPSDAYAIYEAKLKVNGRTYEAIVDSVSDRSTGGVQVQGFIQDEDGLEVGKFSRSLDPEEAVAYNNEFYIDAEYQGEGIGTMFLSHWEDELRAAGYGEMKVTAADIGRYAWAVAGYSWDYAPGDIMDELTHMVQNYNQDMGYEAMDYGEKGDNDSWDAAREMVRNYDAYGEWPEPFELAMLGAGTEDHIGKDVLLSDGMWDGYKLLQ